MRKHSERGNGAVEFALSFAILAWMFFGIVDIGYGAYLYSSLVTRVGDAARYAARLECTQCAGAGSKFDEYKERLQNYVVYGTDTGRLCYDADGSGAGAAVEVAVLGTGLALTAADFLLI